MLQGIYICTYICICILSLYIYMYLFVSTSLSLSTSMSSTLVTVGLPGSRCGRVGCWPAGSRFESLVLVSVISLDQYKKYHCLIIPYGYMMIKINRIPKETIGVSPGSHFRLPTASSQSWGAFCPEPSEVPLRKPVAFPKDIPSMLPGYPYGHLHHKTS